MSSSDRSNWRAIVKEYESLIGTRFCNRQGREFKFFGIVITDEDCYYGMISKAEGLRLLTCVGYLDERGHGFTAMDGPRPAGQSSLTAEHDRVSDERLNELVDLLTWPAPIARDREDAMEALRELIARRAVKT